MKGHYQFKWGLFDHAAIVKTLQADGNYLTTVWLCQYFSSFTSGVVRLPSNHLFPGVPHHVFLLFLGPGFGHFSSNSASLPRRDASPACLSGGNGVKTQAETAPTWSPGFALPPPKDLPGRSSAQRRQLSGTELLSGSGNDRGSAFGKNNSLTSHVEFLRAQVSSPLFFPRVPCWPRDRQRRRTRCGCVTSATEKMYAKYEKKKRS